MLKLIPKIFFSIMVLLIQKKKWKWDLILCDHQKSLIVQYVFAGHAYRNKCLMKCNFCYICEYCFYWIIRTKDFRLIFLLSHDRFFFCTCPHVFVNLIITLKKITPFVFSEEHGITYWPSFCITVWLGHNYMYNYKDRLLMWYKDTMGV